MKIQKLNKEMFALKKQNEMMVLWGTKCAYRKVLIVSTENGTDTEAKKGKKIED